MPLQSRFRRRRAPLPVLATALALALALAPGVPAIAATTGKTAYPAPNFPTDVPARPGALTGTHPKTPADVTAALAQEHYYSSYGTAPRLSARTRPVSVDTSSGIAWLPFVLATGGALIAGIAVAGRMFALRGRRRRGAGLA